MALTVVDANITTTNGSEQTLGGASVTTADFYVLMLDLTNLANGDKLRVRIKTKAASAGSELVAFDVTYAHAQGEPLKFSPPIPNPYSASFTMQLVAGTNRSIPWAILTP